MKLLLTLLIHHMNIMSRFRQLHEVFPPPSQGDYCNLPLYMKSDPFFRKQSEHHDPCPVVPPREASIRGLAQRAYHTQGRHVTMDSKQQALSMGHSGLSNLTSSGASSGGAGGGGGGSGSGGVSASSSSSTLPQRTLTMPGSSASVAQSAAAAAAATAAAAGASSSGGGGVAGAAGGTPGGASSSSSKMGGSRDSLLESSSSGMGRLQKQRDGGAGAYSKSYTLV